jgi:hypothetical protein
MDTFKRILSMSYGRRTGGGEFIKEGFPAFAASEAYSELFMEIWHNPDYAQEFIKSILPPDILPEEGSSQADIPAHMANHPSMQGYKAKQETNTQPNVVETPSQTRPYFEAGEAPAQTNAEKSEYQEFLAFKAAKEAKLAPSSPNDELI